MLPPYKVVAQFNTALSDLNKTSTETMRSLSDFVKG
jgi:hypothetical protein